MLSELAAMLVVLFQFVFSKDRLPVSRADFGFWRDVKTVYSLSVPITLGGLILPLMQLVDSSLVINMLVRAGRSVPDATALYGLSGGPVGSLINMPVVLSFAIATAILPSLSASMAKNDEKAVSKKSALAVQMTMLIALPCACLLAVFSGEIMPLLYGGGLKSGGALDELGIASRLLAMNSASVILVAFIQVSTSMLHAKGKNFLPVISLLAGAITKIGLNVLLLPRIGIYATAVSNISCYIVVFALDLVFMLKHIKVSVDARRFWFVPIVATVFMGALGFALNALLSRFISGTVAFAIAIVAAVVSYIMLLPLLKAFDPDEMKVLPVIGKYFK
jgi:stage V sporulation protein B